MIVVSDTSALLNLALIGRSELLARLYGEVVIPPAVDRELVHHGFSGNRSFIRVEAPKSSRVVAVLAGELDDGEAEAITLAHEIHADLLLIDERRGNAKALAMGLKTTGLLGVLAEAKLAGLITSCQPLVESLEEQGFWLSPELVRAFLRSVGEDHS